MQVVGLNRKPCVLIYEVKQLSSLGMTVSFLSGSYLNHPDRGYGSGEVTKSSRQCLTRPGLHFQLGMIWTMGSDPTSLHHVENVWYSFSQIVIR